MNFTERLDYLLKKNNLNKHKLSVLCEIPYSTIDGWYKKGCENIRLETLRKLSNFFDVSISYWINDDISKIIDNTQMGWQDADKVSGAGISPSRKEDEEDIGLVVECFTTHTDKRTAYYDTQWVFCPYCSFQAVN